MFQALETSPGLGLRLSESPSFLEKLDQLYQQSSSYEVHQENYGYGYGYATDKATRSKDTLQKMKAENFPISLLEIGSWQVKSTITQTLRN